MNRSILSLSVIVACAGLSAGCVSQHSTVHKGVERARVQFENEAAGRIFYEKLSKMPESDHKESRTEFSIPIVFDYERKVITDGNEKFNDAVRQCDTNNDGNITEVEAKIFAGRP